MELTEAQDQRLAERAAAGDDDAFAALVDRHREALVRFVARRTGRGTIAEDAVQDALLSALRALRGGEPPRDVKAWLHTIAWRRAVDLLRREAPAAPGELEDLRTVDGLDVVVGDAQELDRMLRHWACLPHRQRHALAMSVLEGRSLEEIGRAFGVTPDAAKSLVARSRRSLATAVASGEQPVRRRRHLVLLPPALVERLREAATFAVQHEQPASLVTKACAGACAAVLAGSGSAAVVAVAPVEPMVERAAERAERAEKPRPLEARPARREEPVPTATATPAPTPVPTASAPRSRGNTPPPARSGTTQAADRVRGKGRRPHAYPHDDPGPYAPGGGTAEAPPEPTPVPTPAPTADPSAAGTPEPTG